MKKVVTNLTMTSLTLGDGTILAAAGHPGASKPVDVFSDNDQKRLADRGLVSVADLRTEVAPPPAKPEATAKPEAKEPSK
jgi:hypothetical protein